MIKNGEFEFDGKVESPEMRCITIYKNDSQRGEWKSTVKLPIFVDNSFMTLEAPYDSLPTKSSKTVPGCIKITGSPANDLYMKYDKGLEPLSTLNSTLFEKYRVAYYYAKADELGRKNMQPAYDALEELENCKDEIYRYKVKFIHLCLPCRDPAGQRVQALRAGALSLGRRRLAGVPLQARALPPPHEYL